MREALFASTRVDRTGIAQLGLVVQPLIGQDVSWPGPSISGSSLVYGGSRYEYR